MQKVVSSWLGLSIARPRGYSQERGYYLFNNFLLFCSVDKNHHSHWRWINPFPQLLASHYLKSNLVVINSIQDISGIKKFVKMTFEFSSRDPSGFWNPDAERSYRTFGRLEKLSQYPSCFFLGKSFVTIVQLQLLLFGMVLR